MGSMSRSKMAEEDEWTEVGLLGMEEEPSLTLPLSLGEPRKE